MYFNVRSLVFDLWFSIVDFDSFDFFRRLNFKQIRRTDSAGILSFSNLFQAITGTGLAKILEIDRSRFKNQRSKREHYDEKSRGR